MSTPFFGWIRPKNNQKGRSANSGTNSRHLERCVGIWRRSTVRHHSFVTRVGSKRLTSESPLFVTGEEDRGGMPQHVTFRKLPVNPLLDMLEWIRPPKPRIEHAMRENKVGSGTAPQDGVDGTPVVL